ncbi:MAG: GRP family sugar transporter [Thermoplasmatales archaeon]|nr:GRP family sugar transporter [Thermoplasmatales archaeon]
MEPILPMILIIFSALFFGSQFVPKKFCRSFDDLGYNLSMVFGILLNAMIWFAVISFQEKMCFPFTPTILSFFAGIVWVFGNILLISAVSRIGMARSFTIINLVSIISFAGAVLFLGEMRVAINLILTAFAGVVIIMSGCILITLTTSKKEKLKSKTGLVYAFLSSLFFGSFNIIVMYSINVQHLHVNTAALFLALGGMLGAVIILLKKGRIKYWFNTRKKWHGLGVSGGVLWGMGNVLSLYAMQKIGVSISVPMLQGIMTIVSALWGIVIFKELEDVTANRRKKALTMFIAGMILTIAGVWVINQI